jgi:hypothetical protein
MDIHQLWRLRLRSNLVDIHEPGRMRTAGRKAELVDEDEFIRSLVATGQYTDREARDLVEELLLDDDIEELPVRDEHGRMRLVVVDTSMGFAGYVRFVWAGSASGEER